MSSTEKGSSRSRDGAPADYLKNDGIFPSGAKPELLGPHFISEALVAKLSIVTKNLPDREVADTYEEFRRARVAAIVEEIRRAGMIQPSDDAPRSTM